jgi:hypothetical protein
MLFDVACAVRGLDTVEAVDDRMRMRLGVDSGTKVLLVSSKLGEDGSVELADRGRRRPRMPKHRSRCNPLGRTRN